MLPPISLYCTSYLTCIEKKKKKLPATRNNATLYHTRDDCCSSNKVASCKRGGIDIHFSLTPSLLEISMIVLYITMLNNNAVTRKGSVVEDRYQELIHCKGGMGDGQNHDVP